MVGISISTNMVVLPISRAHHHLNKNLIINHSFSLITTPPRTKTPKRLKAFGVIQSKKREEEEEEEELKKKKKKKKDSEFNLKWASDLVLNPDPDNIFAVALTGLLAWASVQVLGQLLFISLAILVAALKYSFIAALLIFILITLL